MDEFFNLLKDYKPNEQALILKAFRYAVRCHEGVMRKSGEPYIVHPVAVATMLAEVHADADTVAAGLLHDTIEDCEYVTGEVLEAEFNPTIAKLVEGVTNINKSENQELDKDIINTLDTKRIITSITHDVRIFIIKLADRLHNMRTMKFQTPDKQVLKSQETLDFYVPIAGYIGEHLNKVEMEDLSFKYIMPKEYVEISELRKRREYQLCEERYETLLRMYEVLSKEKIKFDIEVDKKNLFALYKKMLKYSNIDDIHDFYQIKFTFSNVKDCYKAKKIIEKNFGILTEKSKDYIKYPKTNLYKALHTSIVGLDGHSFQCQFRTEEMKAVNDYGITAYFYSNKKKNKTAATIIQEEVKKMQFYKVLTKLVETPIRPEDFSKVLKNEILSERIYVKTPEGATIELPKGATPVDFAYRIHTEIGNHIQEAVVNGRLVPINSVLKTGDIVRIKYDLNLPPKTSDEFYANTFYAKTRLREDTSNDEHIILRKK